MAAYRIWAIIICTLGAFMTIFSQENPLLPQDQRNYWQLEENLSATLSSGMAKSVELPIPGRGWQTVTLRPDHLIPPGLQNKYPGIRTWQTQLDNFNISLVSGPSGIFALYAHAEGHWLLEPDKHGLHRLAQLSAWASADTSFYSCRNKGDEALSWADLRQPLQLRENKVNHYQYVIAVATTGEYYRANGNSDELVMENVVKVIAQVNAVMTRDLAIKLVLAENTDTLFFKDGATDPYTNGNTSALLEENITATQSRIPFSQFDVGHVFGTNAGGQAFLGAVCGANKSSGASSTFGIYNGSLFYLIVAHELGHQFGASHTFNLCDGENESSGTAFEPGSGSTIMCYAGASDCGPNYVQDRNDPYFHHASLQQINNFKISAGSRCADITPLNSIMPMAVIPNKRSTHIPRGTPIKLEGQGVDADGDSLTYCWEQYNLGPPSTLGSPIGDAPSFRSLPPSLQPIRILPNTTDLLTNRIRNTEVLPAYARNLGFRFTVRDNHPQGGSFAWDEINFKVDTTSGPFKVLFPDNRDTLYGGSYQLIRWAVANTDNRLVQCQLVNIYLSVDGGFTWTDTLAWNTANDGSEYVFIPNIISQVARVIVEAAGNVFFDLSDRNGVILPVSTATSLALIPNSLTLCTPGDSTIKLLFIGIKPEELRVELLESPPGVELIIGPVATDHIPLTVRVDQTLTSQFINAKLRVINLVDTLYFDLPIKTTSSVLSPLITSTPPSGARGLSSFLSFEWAALPDATRYQIQISRNPSFAILVLDTTVTNPVFNNSAPLEAKTIYYWRVKALNDCRSGSWSPIKVFQTELKNCKTYTATDTPAFGVPPFESGILIEDNYMVSEVNLPKVHGFHEFMGNVTIALRTPLDSQTILLKEKCTNLSNYHLGFDDQAQVLSKCPLTDQKIYKPDQPLSKLNGQPSKGRWALRITDKSNNAGTIQAWSLELCTQAATNAPVLDKNLPLVARVNSQTSLTADVLHLTDPDTKPEQLIYTLLSAPLKGELIFQGRLLQAGGQFSQADIDAARVTYRPFQLDTVPDQFDFLAEDGQGGWVIPQTFLIIIEKETSVLTASTLLFTMTPNPATRFILLRLETDAITGSHHYTISLADVTGRQWWNDQLVSDQNGVMCLNISPLLPRGVYVLTIRDGNRSGSKKVVLLP